MNYLGKLSRTFVGTLLLGSISYADSGILPDRSIIGIEIGMGYLQADTYAPLGEADHEGDDVTYGIRLGAQSGDWRSLVILDYFDSSEDDQEYYKGLVTFDYLLLPDSQLHPYIGINLGYISYTTSNPTGDDDDSGFLYGGQTGVILDLDDSFQVDLSYRYSMSGADSVHHSADLIVGLNYKY